MDYDFMNLEADNFIQTFCNLSLNNIFYLNLDKHILGDNKKKCKLYSLKLS